MQDVHAGQPVYNPAYGGLNNGSYQAQAGPRAPGQQEAMQNFSSQAFDQAPVVPMYSTLPLMKEDYAMSVSWV